MPTLLYIEDKLGVTDAYKSVFSGLLQAAGFAGYSIRQFSLYRMPGMRTTQWLIPYRNRKAPTWNPERLPKIRSLIEDVLATANPTVVICADPATVGILGLSEEWATLDNIRGGVYYPFKPESDVPFVFTLPMNVWHTQVKEKDLMQANRGFSDKEEFEAFYNEESEAFEIATPESEDDETDDSSDDPSTDSSAEEQMFYEPLTVPYGRFVLRTDFAKAGRLAAARVADSKSKRIK